MSDQLFDGRRIQVLTMVDAFTKLSPVVEVGMSYRGADVVETLECVTKVYGRPRTIRVDNGREFIGKELDLWAYMNGVILDFSRPGKLTDNASIESFNGSLWVECLNASWFLSLDDARSKNLSRGGSKTASALIGHKAAAELACALSRACLT